MVIYQQAHVLNRQDISLQTQVFSGPTSLQMSMIPDESSLSGSSSSANTEHGYQSSTQAFITAAATQDGTGENIIVGSFFEIMENLYTGELASSMVGLTLLDPVSGLPVTLGTGQVSLLLPLLFNEPIEPVCQYWDELMEEWSETGCVVAEYQPVHPTRPEELPGYVVCTCTHLTTFSCPFIPPVVVPDWVSLTWPNIMEYPVAFIVLVCTTTTACLASLWARRRDYELDHQGITVLLQSLNQKLDTGELGLTIPPKRSRRISTEMKRRKYTDTAEVSRQSIQHWATKRFLLMIPALLRKHSW